MLSSEQRKTDWQTFGLSCLLVGACGLALALVRLINVHQGSSDATLAGKDFVKDFVIIKVQPRISREDTSRKLRHRPSSALDISGWLSPALQCAGSAQRSAFMVRTFKPTTTMSRRVVQWFHDVRSDPCVHTYLSIDQGHPEHKPKVEGLISMLQKSGFEMSSVHRYSADDMLQAYPALQEKRPLGLTWGYHTQAIDLWLQSMPAKERGAYKHLWVLEDDVAYSGDISKLLSAYSANSADLLAWNGQGYHVAESGWWPTALSQEYSRRVSLAQRLVVSEHVERFSAKLLQKLHDWSAAGALDWSESMPATVCVAEGLQCGLFDRQDVGQPYSCCEAPVSTEADWQKRASEDKQRGRARLYHPVKI